MIQARTLTSEAEMRANAVAVRARCFYPKAAPKPQPSQVVTLISYRGYEPPKPPAPVTPPAVPAWQTTPTMFEEHVFAYRAAVKIQEMIAAGEIELVNVERISMSEKYEIEVVRKVYDNKSGASITVGPDHDGLGCIEIDGGGHYGRLVIDPQQAIFLTQAILECAREMTAKKT